MRFYKHPHAFYCGVDLHARSMFTHILDHAGTTVFERDLPASPEAFLDAIAPFREGLVVGVECMFAWYWLADLCEDEAIAFMLGHALYMKAIHGGKAKNDRIDAGKIAGLLRGGMFPMAYVYPRAKRETRAICCGGAASSSANAPSSSLTSSTPTASTTSAADGQALLRRQSHATTSPRVSPIPATQHSIQADLTLIDAFDDQIDEIERIVLKTAKIDDPVTLQFLRTIPGIGKILSLVMLYEIDQIEPFPRGRQLPLLRSLGALRARIGRQEEGLGRQEDRQRPSEVGFQRSGLPDVACHARGEEMAGSARAQAWQEESPIGAGGEDRPHGVSPDAQAAAFDPKRFFAS